MSPPRPETRLRKGDIWTSRGNVVGSVKKYLCALAVERDGNECWFCGGDWRRKGPLRKTLEHLLGKNHPEGNEPENCVVAHEICNNRAGLKSLQAKKDMRARLRSDPTVLPRWLEARYEVTAKRKARRAQLRAEEAVRAAIAKTEECVG